MRQSAKGLWVPVTIQNGYAIVPLYKPVTQIAWERHHRILLVFTVWLKSLVHIPIKRRTLAKESHSQRLCTHPARDPKCWRTLLDVIISIWISEISCQRNAQSLSTPSFTHYSVTNKLRPIKWRSVCYEKVLKGSMLVQLNNLSYVVLINTHHRKDGKGQTKRAPINKYRLFSSCRKQ